MTLGLKFLLWLNGKLFDFKKTSFRYCGFSVIYIKCILVRLWVKVFVSQGWVEAEITINYNSVLTSQTLEHYLNGTFGLCQSQ